MAKIRITENGLKKVIAESVRKILNEADGMFEPTKKYTLPEILSKVNHGDVPDLVRRAGNNRYTPAEWAQAIRGLKVSPQLYQIYQKLANDIEQAQADPNIGAAALRGITSDAEGNTYDKNGRPTTIKGLYDRKVNVNPTNFTSIAQAIQQQARMNPTETISFPDEFTDSVGVFNGLDLNTVKNTIDTKIKFAKGTLMQTNPNAQSYLNIIDQWVNHSAQGLKMKELASAFGSLEQILNTARNDRPVVIGFQKLCNLFGIKDAKGRPLAVDGAIGQNTSAALAQAGFKDIFAFKSAVEAAQGALGIKVDGVVGNDTLTAFQQAGINSFQALNGYRRRADMAQRGAPIPTIQGQNLQGTLSERKIRITESELRELIRESVDEIFGFGARDKNMRNRIAAGINQRRFEKTGLQPYQDAANTYNDAIKQNQIARDWKKKTRAEYRANQALERARKRTGINGTQPTVPNAIPQGANVVPGSVPSAQPLKPLPQQRPNINTGAAQRLN